MAPFARENCSGAPYAGVNDVICPDVFAKEPAIFCASCTTLAIPKSRIFTVAEGERGSPRTKMFAGFTSRCAIPFVCASESASAAGSSRRIVSVTPRGGSPAAFSFWRIDSSVSPSSHSRTMYGTFSPRGVLSIPTSRAWTMAADRSDRSASSAPSRRNSSRSLSRCSLPTSPSALKTFTATGRFQRRCVARYTTAKPPSPTTASMAYFSATVVPISSRVSGSDMRAAEGSHEGVLLA